MANRKWTAEDYAELRRRVEAGQTVREIAAELARTQEATRARMQSVGLTRQRSTVKTSSQDT